MEPGNNKPNNKTNATQIKPISLETKQLTQPSPQRENENFESINESELPTIWDVSNSTATQSSMISQEIIEFPEENQLREDTIIINEAEATKNDTNTVGSQMGSIRDESQDSLPGEQMIMPQTPIE